MELKKNLISLKKQAIDSFKDETDIKRFLDNIVNFNNYSYNNQFLIYLQQPKATYVAPFNLYSKMGYAIKKGETGIKILVPVFLTYVKVTNNKDNDKSFTIKPLFALSEEELKKYKDKQDNSIIYHSKKLSYFKMGNVFDISQTNMPIEIIQEELNPTLEDIRAYDITNNFIKAIYKDGYKVKFEKLDSMAKGYCDFENKTIVIRNDLSDLMKLKVVIHEYAHSLAHQHLKDNNIEYQENRNKYETEAEAIAYVITKYLGLNTGNYSCNYLYSWSKNKDFKEIDDSFSIIVNCSKKIINNYENILEKNKKYESLEI